VSSYTVFEIQRLIWSFGKYQALCISASALCLLLNANKLSDGREALTDGGTDHVTTTKMAAVDKGRQATERFVVGEEAAMGVDSPYNEEFLLKEVDRTEFSYRNVSYSTVLNLVCDELGRPAALGLCWVGVLAVTGDDTEGPHIFTTT